MATSFLLPQPLMLGTTTTGFRPSRLGFLPVAPLLTHAGFGTERLACSTTPPQANSPTQITLRLRHTRETPRFGSAPLIGQLISIAARAGTQRLGATPSMKPSAHGLTWCLGLTGCG